MEKDGVPFLGQRGQHLVLLEVRAEGHKGGRAIVHKDMRGCGSRHQPLKKLVELARVNVAVPHDLDAGDIELSIARKRGIDRVGIKGAYVLSRLQQSLIQQAGDHGFADAALSLQNEMRCCHRKLPYMMSVYSFGGS